MALAALSERHYDSDGSDDYHEASDGRSATVDQAISVAAATPVGVRATADANAETPVVNPPPWSQRAASYPPWSQRGADAATARAATFPFWSQRSTEAGSARLSESLAASKRSPGEQLRGEEQTEKEDLEENAVDGVLSQLSSR